MLFDLVPLGFTREIVDNLGGCKHIENIKKYTLFIKTIACTAILNEPKQLGSGVSEDYSNLRI